MADHHDDEDEFGDVDEEALLLAANQVPNPGGTASGTETVDVKAAPAEGKQSELCAPIGPGSSPTPLSARLKRKASAGAVAAEASSTQKICAMAAGTNKAQSYEEAKHGSLKQTYTLTFGRHCGKTLDEIPTTYMRWILENDVYQGHDDFTEALRAHGDLSAAVKPTANQTANTLLAMATFKAPKFPVEDCFYDSFSREKLWISNSDAKTYFNADSAHMKKAGLVTWTMGGKKWWLFQVYAFAEHFGYVGDKKQTLQALQNFLHKNDVREKEILTGMGLGSPCCGGDPGYDSSTSDDPYLGH